MFAGQKSAQIREILINESAWEDMTCLFAPSLAQQPATPEQLTEILQETPCAAEAFQETLNYQSEPLTLGKANKIASECRKRNEMAEVKRVRENERNKIREKQIQALNDAHSVKER